VTTAGVRHSILPEDREYCGTPRTAAGTEVAALAGSILGRSGARERSHTWKVNHRPLPPKTSTSDSSRADKVSTIERSDKPGGTDVLKLFAEEAKITRQTVETGRVRIARVTDTRDHLVDELLARTDVEVERVPVGRVVEAIPPVRDDGDLMVVPVVEETVVIERKLVLEEEIRIRRERTTERFQETVKLRHHTAEVTRIPAQGPATDKDAVAGAITRRNTEDT
jgi:uncharacterized protein (TIGR02271 family)